MQERVHFWTYFGVTMRQQWKQGVALREEVRTVGAEWEPPGIRGEQPGAELKDPCGPGDASTRVGVGGGREKGQRVHRGDWGKKKTRETKYESLLGVL